MQNATELTLSVVLIALAFIIVLGQWAGSWAARYSQPRAVGEITGGVLFGVVLTAYCPILVSYLQGDTGMVLSIMAQIGILLMMFQVGMEFDFRLLRQKKLQRSVLLIAAGGISLPFALGFGCMLIYAQFRSVSYLWELAFFCGLFFSVTALPILGRILLERQMQNTELGVTVIAVAAINDVIGWLGLGSVLIVIQGEPLVESSSQILMLCVFLIILYCVMRPYLIKHNQTIHVNHSLTQNGVGLLVASIFIASAATSLLGIFAFVGAFLLGTSLYQCRYLLQEWNVRVAPFVNVVLVPAFFIYTGLNVDLGAFDSIEDVLWCVIWLIAATFSKLGACAAMARISGFTWNDAFNIGVLLNTRALMGLVILNVARELSLIPLELYSMFVIVALITTIITAPILNYTNTCLLSGLQRFKEPRLKQGSTAEVYDEIS